MTSPQVFRARLEVATGARTGISLLEDEHICQKRETLSHRMENSKLYAFYLVTEPSNLLHLNASCAEIKTE